MKCTKCGAELEESYDYCANCGSNISEQRVRKFVGSQKNITPSKLVLLITIGIFVLLFSYVVTFNFNRVPSLQGVWTCANYGSSEDSVNPDYYFEFEFNKDGTFRQYSLDGLSEITGSYTESDQEVTPDYDKSVLSVKRINAFSTNIKDERGYFSSLKSNAYEFAITGGDSYTVVGNLNTGSLYICIKK